MTKHLRKSVAIVGAGPAGLIAAQKLAEAGLAENGWAIDIYEAMPSAARKFLLAGRGGLNLTHSEGAEAFLSRYGAAAPFFKALLADFPPRTLRDWAADLGIETFVGSSGRVFPVQFKASPLLRAWLRRLEELGVRLHVRHRWTGFAGEAATALRFEGPDGREVTVTADAVLLALGGASWPRMGATAGWVPILKERGVEVAPLKPANCGFVVAWSERFKDLAEGAPLKKVGLGFKGRAVTGEMILSRYGVEGGAIYALSGALRDAIEKDGPAVLHLDLKRDLARDEVAARLKRPRGKRSLANHLRRTLGLAAPVPALLRECCTPEEIADPDRLADRIKDLPITLIAPRPIERAISTAGGVALGELDGGELDGGLMVTRLPGLFVAGEMLDWEAPTGGYLLQGCFATGVRAAAGILDYLNLGQTSGLNRT